MYPAPPVERHRPSCRCPYYTVGLVRVRRRPQSLAAERFTELQVPLHAPEKAPESACKKVSRRGDGIRPTPLLSVAMRIVIADDERDAADTLAALLETEGHVVRTVY